MFIFDNDQITITILQKPNSQGFSILKKSLDLYKDYTHFIEFHELDQDQAFKSQNTLVIFFDNSLDQQELLIHLQKIKAKNPQAFLYYYCEAGEEQIAQQCLAIGVDGFIYKDRAPSIWPTIKHHINSKNSNAHKSEINQEDKKFQKIFKQLDRTLIAADSYLWEIEFPSYKTNVYSAKEEVLGWKLDKLMNKFESWKNLIHPEDRDKVFHSMEEHLKYKKEYRVEYRALSASGEYFWTISIGQAEWNEKNEPTVFYGVSTNIDPLKKIEQNYRKTSDKFAAFFNNSKDALLIIDTKTLEILDCNQQAHELYGYSKTELTQMKITDLSLEIEKTQLAFSKRVSSVSIRKHKKRDGSPIFIEVSAGYFESDGRELTAAAIRNISERVHDQNQIKISLAEKELLLKEVFHRVKNNLQIVVSILKVQVDSIQDVQTKSIIEQCINRVMSMSLAHEQLYKKDSFAYVDIVDYLNNLAQYLVHSYTHPKNKIQWSIHGDSHQLSLDQIIPLGLIVNELITNSIKHAFADTHEPCIKINIIAPDNKKYIQLHYSDNGPGLPADVKITPAKNQTVGLHLIQLLSRQLEGQLDYQNENGFQFSLRIPLKK